MIRSVSIIIPSLGRTERLRECVGAIFRQEIDIPLDVVVVVDGPDSAQAVEALKAAFPGETRLRFDASPARRGSPMAKNVGASAAKGDVLVFVDDDTVACAGWLKSLVGAYSDGVAGVGGSEEKQRPEGGLRAAWVRFWGNATGKVTRSGLVISNFTPRKTAPEKVGCLAGANMSFLRESFDAVGGFDSNYKGTAYREETDLCLRIGAKSTLLFVPGAKVLHREEQAGGNSPQSVRDWNYWYHRNNTYFFLKNLGSRGSALWFRHRAVETFLALGRTLQQRSFSSLSTMGAAVEAGRLAYEEYARSTGV